MSVGAFSGVNISSDLSFHTYTSPQTSFRIPIQCQELRKGSLHRRLGKLHDVLRIVARARVGVQARVRYITL